MKTKYKVWIMGYTDGRKEWFFETEELANKFLELKKKQKQYHIGPDTLNQGQFGVAPVEVIENEKEFYKSVLR